MGNVKYLDFDDAKKGIIDATHRLVSAISSLNSVNYDTYLDVFAEKFILIVWTTAIEQTFQER